jgi:hypothetical protein
MNVTDLIYGSVSMVDVLQKYHHIGKHGRTNCPIHNGKDDNFCYTKNVYHCWTCGAKGNVIGFVMDLFDLQFAAAIKKINDDFSLNIPLNKTLTYRQKEAIRQRLQEIRKENDKEQKRKQAEMDGYDSLMDEYVQMDRIREKFAPKTPDEPLNNTYVLAMHRLPVIEYRLDSEDWRCDSE